MSFLRASHEPASSLNALCWHVLKTDTHPKEKPINPVCGTFSYLCLRGHCTKPCSSSPCWFYDPAGEGHSPTLCISPLCISQCWGSATTLPMRVSTAWSLFLWDCQDQQFFSAFSLFSIPGKPTILTLPFHLNLLKILIYFTLFLLWSLPEEEYITDKMMPWLLSPWNLQWSKLHVASAYWL